MSVSVKMKTLSPGGGGTLYSVLYGEAPTGRVAFLTSQYIKG